MLHRCTLNYTVTAGISISTTSTPGLQLKMIGKGFYRK